MTLQKSSLALLAVTTLLASAGIASAANSVVGDFSFNALNPQGNANNFVGFPADKAGVSSAWEGFNNAFKAEYTTATYGGALTNAAGSNGVDGPTAGDLSAAAASGEVFEEISNNYANTDPLQSFQAGYTYTLTIGCGLRNGSVPGAGSQLTLQMFWRPADQGAATIVATLPLTVGTTPGFLTTTPGVLTDYSLSFTVPAGDPSIGKPVGILFNGTTPSTVTTGGDFVFDNVRLTSVQVPEPSTYVLLGAGAIGLAGFSRLRRGQQA